jgi:hypothetical protein
VTDVGVLAARDEMPLALAEPHLSLPGDVLDGFGEILLALLDEEGDASGESVGPGGFDEGSAFTGVVGLDDGAEASFAAARVFAGIETEESADLAGDVEAGDIAELGDDVHGDGEPDAAECLESLKEEECVSRKRSDRGARLRCGRGARCVRRWCGRTPGRRCAA